MFEEEDDDEGFGLEGQLRNQAKEFAKKLAAQSKAIDTKYLWGK